MKNQPTVAANVTVDSLFEKYGFGITEAGLGVYIPNWLMPSIKARGIHEGDNIEGILGYSNGRSPFILLRVITPKLKKQSKQRNGKRLSRRSRNGLKLLDRSNIAPRGGN